MRLKEIKPGMVIHCKNIAEYERLEEETIKNGYGKLPLHNRSEDFIKKVVFYINDEKSLWGGLCNNYIEFSDLILPELTAEEVLEICGEICKEYSNKGCDCEVECPFSYHGPSCTVYRAENYDKVIEACEKYKSDHEKKELEIETVDICQIIEIQPDGRKRYVHEEDMNNPNRTLGDKNYLYDVAEILKRYCMEHDGNFIAVHEVVSRVKAVER